MSLKIVFNPFTGNFDYVDTGTAVSGVIYFDTVDDMEITAGSAGQIAYCYDMPDQFWKWSIVQNSWVPF